MEKLVEAARELVGIQLERDQIRALKLYEQELIRWNKRFNLTAISEPEKVRIKHFLDSFSCLLAMWGTPMQRVVDVGTGAGFPGLPLKILCPSIQLTLIESVGKKAEFCRHIMTLLGLEGVEVIQDRAEKVGQQPEYRERFDWSVARAVATLPALVEYLLPLARIGGHVLAQKGEHGPAEAQAAERAIQLLGGHLRQIIPVHLPGVTEDRYLIVVDKVAATPAQYPRRTGVPVRRPL